MTTPAQLAESPKLSALFECSDGTNGIGWCDETYNPWVGCVPVSAGCANCYAAEIAARFKDHPAFVGTTVAKSNGVAWTGVLRPKGDAAWEAPLRWKQPKRIFIGSMTDIFQDGVPDEWLDRVFDVIRRTPHHLYWVLTKRPERMAEYSQRHPFPANVWAGVSVEDQATANERLGWLGFVQGTGTRRWVSYEPALGPVNLVRAWIERKPPVFAEPVSLVIMGGESTKGARPMHPDWARSMRDQCAELETAFRFKQWGDWAVEIDRDHDDPDWRASYKSDEKHRVINLAGGSGFHGERVVRMYRVGTKAAGRLLDGVEHRPLPKLPEVVK
jgi:protein gp37